MAALSGHTALVTGGGRGIGRSLALQLAGLGANVAVMARSADEVNAVAGEIKAKGGKALAVTGDVADYDVVARAVDTISQALGPVDVVVNNAAILGTIDSIENTDPALWAQTQMINVVGPYNVIRATLPGMLAAGWGRVVNIGSGVARGEGKTRLGGYSVSKAALDMLTRNAAAEVTSRGVQINSVYPGVVETYMTDTIRETETAGDLVERFEKMHAAGEMFTPDKSAGLIVGVLFSGKSGAVLDIRQDGDALLGYLRAAVAQAS